MCQIILDKLFVKLKQFLKMEHLKLPSYLNTLEKYNEMICTTDTVKKYEEMFYNLLGDESLPLLDILTLMRCIERDVILVHGNFTLEPLSFECGMVLKYFSAFNHMSALQVIVFVLLKNCFSIVSVLFLQKNNQIYFRSFTEYNKLKT